MSLNEFGTPISPITTNRQGSETEADLSDRLLRDYKQAQEPWAIGAAEDLEYYSGEHWTPEQKAVIEERGQMPVSIQTMWQIVEQAVSMLSANRPSYQASARAEGDQAMARVWSDLFQWMWQQSRGQSRMQTIFRDNYVQGRGVSLVYIDWNADFGKGEVKFMDMDPKDVYADPNSKDPLFDDSPHLIVERIFTLGQIERNWGTDVAQLVWTHGTRQNERGYAGTRGRTNGTMILPDDIMDPNDDQRFSIAERYTKVKRKHYRLMDPANGFEEILSEREHDARMRDMGFIQESSQGQQVVIDKDDVADLEELYNALQLSHTDGLFHMVQPAPQMTAQGPQQLPPEPRPGPAQGEGAIPGSEVKLTPMEIRDLVIQGLVPDVGFSMDRIQVVASSGTVMLYDPIILPTCHYPIINFPGSHNRNPYTIGEVNRMKDPQDVINKSLSLILAHAASSTNQKVFIPRNSSVSTEELKAEWGRAGAAFIEYDPQFGGQKGGIEIVSPPQLPVALYQNLDRSIQLMERIAGIFALQQGDSSAAPETYNATLALDEFGLRRIKGKLDVLYTSLERQGRVMMDFAQKVYTTEKVLRLTLPNGERKDTVLNGSAADDITGVAKKINDVGRGAYDLIVLAGSTMPNNRWAMLQAYMELFERGLVDDIAVLRRTELPDAEEILERNSMYSQMQQAIGQLEEQVKNLKGDLQTAQRESQNAKEQAKLAKFGAQLSSVGSELKKGQEVFDISLKAELDKAKTLINADRKAKTSTNGS